MPVINFIYKTSDKNQRKICETEWLHVQLQQNGFLINGQTNEKGHFPGDS